jgi:hypothetical protein
LSQTLFKWVICVDARYGVADLTASQTTIDKFTSVNPVPNAQVCYFNNVWFMF